MKLAYFLSFVSAGFPSPATDYLENRLDLNDLCIKHPLATFFVRVSGDSMIDKGINEGDILIVDRSLDAKNGDIVIASLHGEFTVKAFQKSPLALLPYNVVYPPIYIKEGMDFEIFGVVTHLVRSLR